MSVFRNDRINKWLTRGGIAVWFLALPLAMYLDGTRPTTADPLLGRIYELNNHGHVVYLTLREKTLFFAVMFGGLGMALVGVGRANLDRPARER